MDSDGIIRGDLVHNEWAPFNTMEWYRFEYSLQTETPEYVWNKYGFNLAPCEIGLNKLAEFNNDYLPYYFPSAAITRRLVSSTPPAGPFPSIAPPAFELTGAVKHEIGFRRTDYLYYDWTIGVMDDAPRAGSAMPGDLAYFIPSFQAEFKSPDGVRYRFRPLDDSGFIKCVVVNKRRLGWWYDLTFEVVDNRMGWVEVDRITPDGECEFGAHCLWHEGFDLTPSGTMNINTRFTIPGPFCLEATALFLANMRPACEYPIVEAGVGGWAGMGEYILPNQTGPDSSKIKPFANSPFAMANYTLPIMGYLK